ncbi:MAG: hypothetical protein RLZZ393_1682 [Pseudomonadota bacterium]|jgi:hypothetical protein
MGERTKSRRSWKRRLYGRRHQFIAVGVVTVAILLAFYLAVKLAESAG